MAFLESGVLEQQCSFKRSPHASDILIGQLEMVIEQEELEQLEAETLGLVTDAAGKQPPPKNGRTLADVWHPYNPYRARLDINPDFLSTEQESGRIRH